jgi:hypothetical protein
MNSWDVALLRVALRGFRQPSTTVRVSSDTLFGDRSVFEPEKVSPAFDFTF